MCHYVCNCETDYDCQTIHRIYICLRKYSRHLDQFHLSLSNRFPKRKISLDIEELGLTFVVCTPRRKQAEGRSEQGVGASSD